ncbi:MAG: hypothetical protein U0270_25180 [Labilithrix sp.]
MRTGANARSGVAASAVAPRSFQCRRVPSHGPAPTIAAVMPSTAPKSTASPASEAVGAIASSTRWTALEPGRRTDSPRSSAASPRKKCAYCSHIGSSRWSLARSAARSASLD